MTVECPECGEAFDTERGLEIHERIDHKDIAIEEEPASDDIVGQVISAWQHSPKFAFLVGALVGVVLAGTIVLSAPDAFQPDDAGQVGERVVNHYSSRAPAGVSYELADVRQEDSGIYAVTVDVTSAGTTYSETVYVTPDGSQVFETPPTRLRADISSFSEQ